MDNLEITWERAIGIWWLIIWRMILGSIVLGIIFGFVAGFMIGLIGTALGLPHDSVASFNRFVVILVGSLTNIVWGITVVRMALRKQYTGFRLALVPNSSN
jgi:hypothetical protein